MAQAPNGRSGAPKKRLRQGAISFSGAVERVSRESMSLQLADGVAVDAALPPTGDTSMETIAKRYEFGDQVSIACQFLAEPVFDMHEGRYLVLVVNDLRYFRHASAEELARIGASHPFGFNRFNVLRGAPDSIVPAQQSATQPATGGDQSSLEHMRAVNLAYIHKMPDFLADEIAESYVSPGVNPPQWEHQDTIESEIGAVGGGDRRRNVRKNGQPWTGHGLPEFLPYGGHSPSTIWRLFDEHCPNKFEPAGSQQERGTHLSVYRVTSPGPCFTIRYGYETYRPAYAGRLLVEYPGGRLVRFEYEVREFPTEFPLSYWKWETSWGEVKIGDASYLLPVSAGLIATYSAMGPYPGHMIRMTSEYKNYRHFEASSGIQFH